MQATHLHLLIITLGFTIASCFSNSEEKIEIIQTVNGPINSENLGLSLIHEHVFLDWRSAEETDPGEWDNDAIFKKVLPYILEMKKLGVNAFFECTPVYLGRNVNLLKQIADKTGIQIITNTGYYGFNNNAWIPDDKMELNANQISKLWISEFRNGIDNSKIRPGFIKISVEPRDSLTRFHTTLVKAAAITHRETGLTIVSHTGVDTTAALQLKVIAEIGVAADAFVWTHAQNGTSEGHIRFAKKGAWISLDGLGWVSPEDGDSTAIYEYIDFLVNLKEENLLDRTLISHDAGWVSYNEINEYKKHTAIFELLFPALLKIGFDESDFHQLLIENPKDAFTIRKRIIKNH